MIAAVWNVEGSSFDVDGFLQTYGFEADTIWHGGDQKRRGHPFNTSGFRLSLDSGDADQGWEHIMQDIQEFFVENETITRWLHTQGLDQELDIGMTVGGHPYTQTLAFPVAFLTLLTDHGVNLAISAYPLQDPA